MYAYQKRLYCVFIIFNFAILQTIVQITYAQPKVSPTKKRDKRDYLEKDLDLDLGDYLEKDLTSSEEMREYFDKASSEENAPSLQKKVAEEEVAEEEIAEERRFYDSEEKKFIAEILKSPSAIENMTPEERARLIDAINAASSEEVSNNPLKKAHTNLLAGGVVEEGSSEEVSNNPSKKAHNFNVPDAFVRRKWEIMENKRLGRHTGATAKNEEADLQEADLQEAYTDLLFPEEKMFPVFSEEKMFSEEKKEAYTDLPQLPQLPQLLNAEQTQLQQINAVNAEQTQLPQLQQTQLLNAEEDSSEVNENSGTWTFNFAGLVKNTGVIINAVSVPLAFGIVATAAGTLAIWIDRFRHARLRGKEKDEATKDEKKGLVETV